MALNIFKSFYKFTLALSTGKKRKRGDVTSSMGAGEEEEGRAGEAAVRKLRLTASAPEHKVAQQTAPPDRQLQAVPAHPAPHQLPYSPAFTFSIPCQPHAAAAAAPPSTGLHNKLKNLKESMDIGHSRKQQAAGHPHHPQLSGQQQQQQQSLQGQPAPQPAWVLSAHQLQPKQPQAGLVAGHDMPVVAKQLHADFNNAARAKTQLSTDAQIRSGPVPSPLPSSATRPQPMRRPVSAPVAPAVDADAKPLVTILTWPRRLMHSSRA